MRAGLSLLVLLAACNSNVASAPTTADSVRDRLATSTQLLVSTTGSTGSIVAAKKTSDGWTSTTVPLALDAGHLTAIADNNGTLFVESLDLALAPVEIPASVLGHEAQLTNLRLALAAPASVATTWSDDDNAHVTANLSLVMSWSLSIDGTALPLGAPKLPPIAVTIDVSGDGAVVAADTMAHAAGDLWTWADLVKLSDLDLAIDAQN